LPISKSCFMVIYLYSPKLIITTYHIFSIQFFKSFLLSKILILRSLLRRWFFSIILVFLYKLNTITQSRVIIIRPYASHVPYACYDLYHRSYIPYLCRGHPGNENRGIIVCPILIPCYMRVLLAPLNLHFGALLYDL
jgi:hypothetical protein